MFESRDTPNESQPQLWVEARRLPKANASIFYRKLDALWKASASPLACKHDKRNKSLCPS
jgi:hypothetical protein